MDGSRSKLIILSSFETILTDTLGDVFLFYHIRHSTVTQQQTQYLITLFVINPF